MGVSIWPWVLLPGGAAVLAILRLWRVWLFYYVLGAVGFTLAVVALFHGGVVEQALAGWTGGAVHFLAAGAGVPTRLFRDSPGSLLVLLIGQGAGWTVLRISMACSGLLEEAVFAGLVLFLPGMGLPTKLWSLVWGEAFTFASNVLRVLLIVVVVHFAGKSSIYFSHMVLAQLVFFALTIWLYWMVFTRHALRVAHRKMRAAGPARGGV